MNFHLLMQMIKPLWCFKKICTIKKIIFCCFCLFLAGCGKREKSTVLVLPTLHGYHKSNPHYSYEDLLKLVNGFKPDVIAVEIRPEDIAEPREYLRSFYPEEMVMIRDSFPDITVGIDYYGEDFRNQLLPAEVFKDTTNELGRFAFSQRKLNADTLISLEMEKLGMDVLLKKQIAIAGSYSAGEMINGEYDSLTYRYYNLLDTVLEGTDYRGFAKFNTARDIQITQNAVDLIKKNPGKRIIVLVGANHRNRLVKTVSELNSVENLDEINSLNRIFSENEKAPVVKK